MLLKHLLLNSGSVECTSLDFFLRLFRNYVYYHFICPKIIKREQSGVGLGKFFKIDKRGGGDHLILESKNMSCFQYKNHYCSKENPYTQIHDGRAFIIIIIIIIIHYLYTRNPFSKKLKYTGIKNKYIKIQWVGLIFQGVVFEFNSAPQMYL